MITIYTGNIAHQMAAKGDTAIRISPQMQTEHELVQQGMSFARINPAYLGKCDVFTNSHAWFSGLRLGIKESPDPTTHRNFAVVFIDLEGRRQETTIDMDGNPLEWPSGMFQGVEDALLRLL